MTKAIPKMIKTTTIIITKEYPLLNIFFDCFHETPRIQIEIKKVNTTILGTIVKWYPISIPSRVEIVMTIKGILMSFTLETYVVSYFE